MNTLSSARLIVVFALFLPAAPLRGELLPLDRDQFTDPQQVTWSGWAKSNPTSDNPYYFNPLFIASNIAGQFDHTVAADQRDGGTLASGPCACDVVLTLRLDQPVLRLGFDFLERPLLVDAFDACNRPVGSLAVQPDASGWSFCGFEEPTGAGIKLVIVRVLIGEETAPSFAVIDDILLEGEGLARPLADFNCDLRVDLIDFATFSRCFGHTFPSPTCEYDDWDASDLTGNWVVDLDDFATFAALYTP